MLLIADIRRQRYMLCVDTFMICVPTKFHITSSSCSLVIVIKLKTEQHFHTSTNLFYILLHTSSRPMAIQRFRALRHVKLVSLLPNM
jgi:hypothetical protein